MNGYRESDSPIVSGKPSNKTGDNKPVSEEVERRGVRNEPRNVAIFLMRRIRGERLEEIGKQFGIAKYSSVSSVIEQMKRDISVDRRLKARVKSIEKIFENSQQKI